MGLPRNPPYKNRPLLIALSTLEKRRLIVDISSLVKLINGVKPKPLLSVIYIEVPLEVVSCQCKSNYELLTPLSAFSSN